jgi:hypothetical protein
MAKIVLEKNAFGSLQDASDDDADGDDFDESSESQPSGPSSALATRFSEAFARGQPIVANLLHAIDSTVHLSQAQRAQLFSHWETYDNLSPDDYREKLNLRFSSLARFEDPELIDILTTKLNEFKPDIEINAVFVEVCRSLTPKRQAFYGQLFLLDLYFSLFPSELATLNITPDLLTKVGPILTYLVGRLVIKNSPFDPGQIVSIFRRYFFDKDAAAAPISVAAIHIVAMSLERWPTLPFRLRATHWVELGELCRLRLSNRDQHVRTVALTVRSQCRIADPENLIPKLLQSYQGCPVFVQNLIVEACKKDKVYLQGWLRAYPTMQEVTRRYLDAIGDKLPQEMRAQFGEDPKEIEREYRDLDAHYKRLRTSSVVSIFVMLVAGAAAWVAYYPVAG